MNKQVVGHTAGPWEIDAQYGNGQVFVQNNKGEYVAEVTSDHGENQIEANARLIASAPTMLEAIRELVDKLADVPRHVRTRGQQKALNVGLEAINKAQGGKGE